MHKMTVYFALIALVGITTGFAYSQEISHATFQETAQIIIDKSISQNVRASITLQSTSILEIKIPAELDQEIRGDSQIVSIVFTNQDTCVLGVTNESCVMINVKRDPNDSGIVAIQESTKETGNLYIDRVNEMFDTDAQFHSVFIHSSDASVLGITPGRGTVSAVYTLPMEDTSSMYEKISGILLPKIIRDSGGFYNVAKNISSDENASMTFSWVPSASQSLLQLQISVDYPDKASSVSEISPLEFLKVDDLARSEYFATGFYPLNSIIQVIVLSPEDTKVSGVRGNILPTQTIDNEEIPTDVTREGWVFDPQEGQLIQAKYIFGEKTSVSSQELKFSLGGTEMQAGQEFDESIIIVIVIAIVAIVAAIFYLKR